MKNSKDVKITDGAGIVTTKSSARLKAVISESEKALKLNWVQKKITKRFERVKTLNYTPFSLK